MWNHAMIKTKRNMKYSNCVSQYTQKLQTLAYVEKKSINLKKRHERITTKQLKANFYIPINKVPCQQSAFNKKSNFLRKLVK